MSTSISKNINHPPSGFNPHAPDPASECIVIRGRSISAQSFSPAKNLKMWKPHWWSAFLGTQKTLSCCFFIVFFLLKWWINVNFRGWGGGRNSSSYRSLISWSDTILREISTFSSLFPKGDPATQSDRYQPIRETSLGIQVHPLWAFTNEMASPNSKPLPLLSVLLVCASLAVEAGTDTPSEWVQACFSHCLCWRPFPLLRFTLKRVSKPVCGD